MAKSTLLRAHTLAYLTRLSMTNRVTRFVDFLPFVLLLEAHYDFLIDEVAQNNGDFLGHFLFKHIYYIFALISSFKTWFVVGILRF
jgi:hypothetical protein